jgi:hypothetical protein
MPSRRLFRGSIDVGAQVTKGLADQDKIEPGARRALRHRSGRWPMSPGKQCCAVSEGRGSLLHGIKTRFLRSGDLEAPQVRPSGRYWDRTSDLLGVN